MTTGDLFQYCSNFAHLIYITKHRHKPIFKFFFIIFFVPVKHYFVFFFKSHEHLIKYKKYKLSIQYKYMSNSNQPHPIQNTMDGISGGFKL